MHEDPKRKTISGVIDVNPDGVLSVKPDRVTSSTGQVKVGSTVSGTVIITGNKNIAVSKDLTVRDIPESEFHGKKIISAEQAFERIASAVKLNLTQIESNIEKARKESSQFFRLMLFFASLGFLVVLSGVVLLYIGQIGAGVVASISGIIPELTAVLFSRKDQELRKTIEDYHKHMLHSQRLLTMIDVAETIKDNSEQDRMKTKIIMSTLSVDSGKMQ